MNKAKLLLLLLFLALCSLVFAANDPGHDSLYVLKIGDSNVAGSINITNNITGNYIRAATLLYGDQIDIRANGTIQTVSNRPAIQADANDLYLDAKTNLYIATRGGTTNTIQIGPVTGSSLILNVSGTIKQQNVAVCLANGTNCPSTSGNTTGAGATNTLAYWTSGSALGASIVSQSGNTLTIAGNISIDGPFYIGNGANANSTASLAIGLNALATDIGATAMGDTAQATKSSSTAIGDTAQATGSLATAVGYTATANDSAATAYGASAAARGASSIAIGSSSFAAGSSSTAVGSGASSTASSATLVGAITQAGVSATALGYNVIALGSSAIGIGNSAFASASESIAIGELTNASFASSVALGYTAKPTATNQLAVGSSTQNLNTQIFGTLNTTSTIRQNNVAVCLSDGTNCPVAASGGWLNTSGNINQIDTTKNVSANALFVDNTNGRVGIGTTTPTAKFTVNGAMNITGNITIPGPFFIGEGASAINTSNMAIGVNAAATGQIATAIGTSATASNASTLAVGISVTASGVSATAIGYTATASNQLATAVGSSATANNSITTAMGANSLASGASSTTLGAAAVAYGASSIAIGKSSAVYKDQSIGIGVSTLVNNTNSVALGYLAQTTADNQLAIGNISNTLNTQIFGTLNTTGAIKQNNVAVCLADGSNCPGGAGAGWINGTTQVWLANNNTNVSIDFASGQPTLFIDTTSNKVGINTSTPSATLEVQTAPTNNGITISTNSNQTNALTDAPILQLLNNNVSNNQSFSNRNYVRVDFSTKNSSGTTIQGASILAIFTNHTNTTTGYNGQLAFYTNNAGTNTEAMRIDNLGNIGMGITAPTNALDVAGTVNISNGNLWLESASTTDSGNIFLGGNTSSGAVKDIGMRFFGGNLSGLSGGFIDVKANISTEGLRFRVDSVNGGTERIRITAGGLTGINTTTPLNTLNVKGDVNVTGTLYATNIYSHWINRTTIIQNMTGTTLKNISGLAWAAAANTNYVFDCSIYYQSNNTANGISFAIDNWGGSATRVKLGATMQSISATTVNSGVVTATATKVTSTDVTAVNTNYQAFLRGIVINGATAVTITPQYSAEVAGFNVTIREDSFCNVDVSP